MPNGGVEFGDLVAAFLGDVFTEYGWVPREHGSRLLDRGWTAGERDFQPFADGRSKEIPRRNSTPGTHRVLRVA